MTNTIILATALILAGYLSGSLSSAIIISKLWGLPDPRQGGSKNPGATNMLRIGGKLPAVCTLLGDAFKGFIPVYATKLFFPLISPWIISGVFLAAVLGHLYPLFFQFKGGKGVATALGGLFGLMFYLGLSFVGIWLAVAIISRYSSLSALSAISLVSIISYLGMAPEYSLAIILVACLLFWRHRPNIQNLLRGQEGKIGQKN